MHRLSGYLAKEVSHVHEMSPSDAKRSATRPRKLGGAVPWRVLGGDRRARASRIRIELIGDRPTVGPNFMPIFIERFARERLQAVAQAEGLVSKALPEVLFVCVHNAGAARWRRRWRTSSRADRSRCGRPARPDRADRPGGGRGDERDRHRCPDGVPEAADGRGRPRRRRRGDDGLRGLRVRSIPASATRTGRIADPAGQPLDVVRQIRDDVRRRVGELLETLTPTAAGN